ncbi:hypothetical protein SCATT_25730 [Streptantibioticus cattleyicolor NRRL 8057 = DSM 46488]|uniref:Uncharacterized protein n=1 Tax=Streptantibioticus cattleyicolor (strain ATCC 35852 / DSM 46488 / JCM 4925 / NBRC 14057 / NRRL 8057) TaxID=1003195 RepID=G8WWQ5_STREN|nr:hypothetical protein SCATT_25730 [Streptantibioticus cattleyicolor NRRL 8057 = DSM 46488]
MRATGPAGRGSTRPRYTRGVTAPRGRSLTGKRLMSDLPRGWRPWRGGGGGGRLWPPWGSVRRRCPRSSR